MVVALDSDTSAPHSGQGLERRSETVAKNPRRVESAAQWFLLSSFSAAVLLSLAAFIAVGDYLFRYLHVAISAFDAANIQQLTSIDLNQLQDILLARTGLWKFILQSCGVMAGAAFGFLGFALFLLGVKGDMDAAYHDAHHKVQLTRMAPGTFVILMASVLVGFCSTAKVELDFDVVTGKGAPGSSMPLGYHAEPQASSPATSSANGEPDQSAFDQAIEVAQAGVSK